MNRKDHEELRKALYKQWDNLLGDMVAERELFKTLLQTSLDVHSYCEELEERIQLLEKRP